MTGSQFWAIEGSFVVIIGLALIGVGITGKRPVEAPWVSLGSFCIPISRLASAPVHLVFVIRCTRLSNHGFMRNCTLKVSTINDERT